jgi:hypothetical protein
MSEQLDVDSIDFNGALFDDDLEIDEVPDNPNFLPDDVYHCKVTEAILKPTSKKDKIGITLKYQIIAGDYSIAFPFTEWLWVPRKPHKDYEFTPEEKRANSRLKLHFAAAGYGADEMKKLGAKDFIGRELKVRTRNKPDSNGMDRPSVVAVMPVDDGDSSSDANFSPFGNAAGDI